MATTQCLPLDAQNWSIFVREAEAVEAATGGGKKKKKKNKKKKLPHARTVDSINQMFFIS